MLHTNQYAYGAIYDYVSKQDKQLDNLLRHAEWYRSLTHNQQPPYTAGIN